MKQSTLIPLLVLLCSVRLFAQTEAGWLRYPSISPDGKTIVFTYKGDLYSVPAAGGAAVPLTLHEAYDFMPVWSHDGKYIAFASDRYGNFDVFVMPAQGGEARRLTFHSAAEYPYDFSANDQSVLFGSSRMDAASNRQFPAASQPELYQVGISGGRVTQVLTTPAEDAKYSADGKLLIYHDKKGGENTWRKHHVSSIARDIWLYNTTTGRHTKLTGFAGEDRNPVFAENDQSVYYLSEAAGSFNVYHLAEGGSPQQLTHFTQHPVRFLSKAADGTLCFSYDGHLYTLQPGREPKKVPVVLNSDYKVNNEKILPVTGGARDLAVSPNGKEVAFVFRGEVFVTSVDGGTTKRITNTPEQERKVSFSPDGRSLLYSSERGNSWKIFQTTISRKEEPYFFTATVLKETPVISNDKENYQPSYSPDGKEIAFVENRNTLKIYNIASGQVRTLLTAHELFSMSDNDQYFTWSPDGKWMLFEYSEAGIGNSEVGIVSTDGKGKLVNLTESGYSDGDPKWMMDGKMMIWTSNRDGLRSYANSGGSQDDVYGLFFTQQAWDRFKLTKEEAALLKEQEEKAVKADSAKKSRKDSTVTIEWEGLPYRKAKLTVNSADMSDALVSKDGEMLYYLARFEKGLNLWSTNLRTRETKILVPLNADGGSMVWDKEQKNIFLLADGKISRIEAASGKQTNVGINGEINLDVAAERQFMFEHVWRRTKETFYTAGYHGAQWDELKKAYESYLPHIGSNFEFAEMLSELLGELNVSHSGASYGAFSANGDATASLGAFYDETYTGNGVKITEVIKDGPLDKAGFGIQPGDIIEAIDGETVLPSKDLAVYLNRKAGKNVLLSVNRNNNRKEIVVKPVSLVAENALLYKRWVRRNQDEVDKLSHGQLGYVHIPGMNDNAYRSAYADIMGRYAGKKGLVVDTRFNGGGDLVADLAMFLSGKRFLEYTTDNRTIAYEPTFRWNKPSIALASEANYSDGHCFAFSYQNLHLGKLVGMPVPGTCTFAGWEALQDNSVRWGVPPLGVKNMQGQYLENHQTTPDIMVMNEYEKVSKGEDQQLEAAVQALLKEVEQQPGQKPQ
jgi:Tol biopolymer transport system component/C-terminal processing protease CtpA/Prc